MKKSTYFLHMCHRGMHGAWFMLLLAVVVLGCKKNPANEESLGLPFDHNGLLDFRLRVNTDKSAYAPGEAVAFVLNKEVSVPLKVKYKWLGELLGEQDITGSSWSWIPPSDDFKGYLAEIYALHEGEEYLQTTIAVDVSSSWIKFPRYGFLSKYPGMSTLQQDEILDNLKRHHITGLQFYDWQYKHHKPLAGTVQSPAPSWLNLFGAQCSGATVKYYIDGAHARNMKAMAYNLIFGAVQDAEEDGVLPQWYAYKDNQRGEIDNHHLDPPFLSSIYLTNPGNTGWQQFLNGQNNDMYEVYPFDGFHMDQLGNRNMTHYDYDGQSFQMYEGYGSFINAAKAAKPDKFAVLNAVSQYGQPEIAEAASDFLYSEVWDATTYEDLANIIKENDRLGNYRKNSVIAGYMNYGLSGSQGFFNTPGVLLTNAVIFSHGGAHIELGEHMLSNEFFPNSNLIMRDNLKEAIIGYYDFLTAYQNLLRDGGNWYSPSVTTSGTPVSIASWPARNGQVASFGKHVGSRDVIHLINFVSASHMEWKDYNGTQAEPVQLSQLQLQIGVNGSVKKVWWASPDVDKAKSNAIDFEQQGGTISLQLPKLKYWDMIVIEYN
ncbi:glycoside hydrolase family 66 protein [Olivibacter sitiensis]|uniref:glycoside hydrolase family 66 protein n=1 Tax=Olivibacter sitiensis TaxID=376470 RepID=UPI000406E8E8|nr:glycoside hydrolase family 66 protein [Olivibacter sitiensis]